MDGFAEFKEFQHKASDAIMDVVLRHNIARDLLTEEQTVRVILDAFRCGDIQRHIRIQDTGTSQMVDYVPYRREQELLDRIKRLEDLLASFAIPHDLKDCVCNEP